MGQHIKGPMVLRISEAEIVESQLSEDDLRALSDKGQGSASPARIRCPVLYCAAMYDSEQLR
ncbi:hypothetical protein [Nonomuraea gerenzanensis]|uniref:Uncharacterized protein n=1 Tax=Nonomuraea gerenzanensis TaxID=93944 RepID=A0A1M4EAV3_9ACTN|nr:hypothetical protein [Nonomuraea gerenzanensis]UBU18224.1 hypothetical protein LCN96_25320 [Nonomuraea gerenzanensis]SBO96039.1 hypothetical protein BN4615_P5555 [Nonomuraea gerenzanensis]